MADLTTFKGLCEAVADYLGREDLTERIPTFIRLAEQRMNRELRLRVMERRAVATVDAGDLGAGLPNRREPGAWDVFLEMRDVAWRMPDKQIYPMQYMPPDHYREAANVTGVPRQYTIIGDKVFFSCVPDAPGDLLLTYYAEIPPLGEKQETNCILQTAPDLYLYAALLESVAFTRGSVPAKEWAEFYAGAKNKLDAAEQRARFTSNLTMRPVRRI